MHRESYKEVLREKRIGCEMEESEAQPSPVSAHHGTQADYTISSAATMLLNEAGVYIRPLVFLEQQRRREWHRMVQTCQIRGDHRQRQAAIDQTAATWQCLRLC